VFLKKATIERKTTVTTKTSLLNSAPNKNLSVGSSVFRFGGWQQFITGSKIGYDVYALIDENEFYSLYRDLFDREDFIKIGDTYLYLRPWNLSMWRGKFSVVSAGDCEFILETATHSESIADVCVYSGNKNGATIVKNISHIPISLTGSPRLPSFDECNLTHLYETSAISMKTACREEQMAFEGAMPDAVILRELKGVETAQETLFLLQFICRSPSIQSNFLRNILDLQGEYNMSVTTDLVGLFERVPERHNYTSKELFSISNED